jgi:hypothetical protein
MSATNSRTYPLSGCKHIHFSALGNITLIQIGPDESESVLAEGTPEALEHIKVEPEGINLHIRLYTWYDFLFLPHSASFTIRLREIESFNISGSAELDCAQLTSPELELGISGSGHCRVKALSSPRLVCSSSGSGDFEIGAMETVEVSAGLSGSGRCRFTGSADRLTIRVSGSGDIDASQLAVRQEEIHISGSAHVVTQVSESLDVHISGAGEILYKGSPQITQSISGSATIRKL